MKIISQPSVKQNGATKIHAVEALEMNDFQQEDLNLCEEAQDVAT